MSAGTVQGGVLSGRTQKAAAAPQLGCRGRFSATKNHRLRTCRPLCFPHLSSSPDLRIKSNHTAFSGQTQWPTFVKCDRLHAYSGGTVRDSHPVLYSPVGLLPHPQALKRNIYLRKHYIRFASKSQSKERKLSFYSNRSSHLLLAQRTVLLRYFLHKVRAVEETIEEGFAFVGGTEAAAEIADGIVIAQG